MNELNEKKDWIQIGSGQFGEVYKAMFNRSQTKAIKVNKQYFKIKIYNIG